MISLGQASNFSLGEALGFLFASGKPKDQEFLRKNLAKRYGAKKDNVALYHSGRSALAVALRAVGKPGDKVILPGLTCIAVVRAIKSAQMEPVFVDIEPENLDYNYDKLEAELQGWETNQSIKSIDKKGEVCYNGIILCQNTLGIAWRVQKIEKLAKKYNLAIVEDLAHCAGRFYDDGREIGTVGAATALSFGKGKALDTTNGGAVVLRNVDSDFVLKQPIKLPKITERWRNRWYPILASFCRTTWRVGIGKICMTIFVKLGFVKRSADTELNTNVGLTNWQAKQASKQLDGLSKQPLRGFVFVNDRAEVLKELSRAGYNLSEIWYDTPVSPKRYAGEVDFPSKKCPEAVWISEHILNLPNWYPEKDLVRARKIMQKYAVEKGKQDE